MSDLFHIEEPDLANQTTDAPQVWYVKEGDFTHCTCSSEEVAKLSLKHFMELHLIDASLKDCRIDPITLTFEEHIFIAQSKLAIDAFEKIKITLEINYFLREKLNSAPKQSDTALVKDRKNKSGLKG